MLILSGQGESGIFCTGVGRRIVDEFPDKTIMFISWWEIILAVFEDEGKNVPFIEKPGVLRKVLS